MGPFWPFFSCDVGHTFRKFQYGSILTLSHIAIVSTQWAHCSSSLGGQFTFKPLKPLFSLVLTQSCRHFTIYIILSHNQRFIHLSCKLCI